MSLEAYILLYGCRVGLSMQRIEDSRIQANMLLENYEHILRGEQKQISMCYKPNQRFCTAYRTKGLRLRLSLSKMRETEKKPFSAYGLEAFIGHKKCDHDLAH